MVRSRLTVTISRARLEKSHQHQPAQHQDTSNWAVGAASPADLGRPCGWLCWRSVGLFGTASQDSKAKPNPYSGRSLTTGAVLLCLAVAATHIGALKSSFEAPAQRSSTAKTKQLPRKTSGKSKLVSVSVEFSGGSSATVNCAGKSYGPFRSKQLRLPTSSKCTITETDSDYTGRFTVRPGAIFCSKEKGGSISCKPGK